MILIVGLGNPGPKYARNRHNVGFMFIDFLLKAISPETQFSMDSKYNAEIAVVKKGTETFIFLKPQTFMNKSGDAVQRVMAFYKVPLENLYVAHDELDIPIGKTKVQVATGPKLHNGLDSINMKLSNINYHRIRIGVDNRDLEHRISGEAYVLQDFTASETEILHSVFGKLKDQLSFPLGI